MNDRRAHPRVPLHDRLAADTHFLLCAPTGDVLLHRNAALPWFILVPDVSRTELVDVPRDRRLAIYDDTDNLAAAVRTVFAPDKLNVAAIGNVVSQLHIHVVARRHDDACWPAPVWGHLEPGPEYPDERVSAIAEAIRRAWPANE